MASQDAVSSQDLADGKSPFGNTTVVLQTGRTFLLNVPDAYEHGQPHPLVLSFHGAGFDSTKDQETTGLSGPSLRIASRPFLTVYGQGEESPAEGQGRVWTGAPYENKQADDIQYVHDILAKMSSTHTVDKSRIYACGVSNGGGFVNLLASHPRAPPVFAALAMVCPALYHEPRIPDDGTGPRGSWRPVPVLSVHGLADAVVPFFGRPDKVGWGALPDVRWWRRRWAERNRGGTGGRYPGELASPDGVTEVYPGVWEEVWDGGERAEVRALTVEGLGHDWPTVDGPGVDERDAVHSRRDGAFRFTEDHLVPFFSKHEVS